VCVPSHSRACSVFSLRPARASVLDFWLFSLVRVRPASPHVSSSARLPKSKVYPSVHSAQFEHLASCLPHIASVCFSVHTSYLQRFNSRSRGTLSLTPTPHPVSRLARAAWRVRRARGELTTRFRLTSAHIYIYLFCECVCSFFDRKKQRATAPDVREQAPTTSSSEIQPAENTGRTEQRTHLRRIYQAGSLFCSSCCISLLLVVCTCSLRRR
jgi:hypothetical protein